MANRLALERGLMPRATLPDVNRSGVFPGLGTEAPSLLKSEYVSFITPVAQRDCRPRRPA